MLPYTETNIDNYVIREFNSNIKPEELNWHRDHEDREIYPLCENDWYFQFDNELPIRIDNIIKIKEGSYHRIIKGTTDLKLKIIKK